MNYVGTIHKAGPLVDNVQLCINCGAIICDFRRSMWIDGAPSPDKGFAEGRDVTILGNCSAVGIHEPAIRCNARPA